MEIEANFYALFSFNAHKCIYVSKYIYLNIDLL